MSTSSSWPFHLRTLPATITVSTLLRVHQRYDRPRHVVERRHVGRGRVEDDDVGLLARRERTGLAVQPQVLRAVDGGEPQHVAHIEERRRVGGRRRPLVGDSKSPCSRIIWFTTMRCMVIAERIWVKKSAVIVTSTSELRDGSMPSSCILRMGGMPWRMFISIGKAIETCTPLSLTPCQPRSDIPVMWMNRLSGPSPMSLLTPPVPCGEIVQDRADPERREDVRRNLETELAPDLPGLRVGRFPQVDLAAHDHVDELVARGEPLLLDAERILRILVAGDATRALEIAEGGAAPGIEEGLDGGVGVLRASDGSARCRGTVVTPPSSCASPPNSSLM